MRFRAVLLSAILVLSAAAPVAGVAGATQESDAYDGSHVSFETASDAVVDYGVDGAVLVDAVEVESRSNARQRGGLQVDAGLSATTSVRGSTVSTQARSETRASMQTESGAAIDAHDASRGNLVVRAPDSAQIVGVNVSEDARARAEDDGQVVLESDDGTRGTFLVVGDGDVVVNDEGDVTAELEEQGSLVYRQYAGERSDSEREQEDLISNGTAAAEVYVTAAGESGSETAADVVQYSEDTTVEVVRHGADEIRMTADRSERDGRVVVTSVSEQAFDTARDIEVTVDGEAATRVDSSSELRSAADGGDSSAFTVEQATTAEASTDVVIAVNHFSERTLAIDSDTEEETTTATDGNQDGSDGTTLGEDGPGFGVLAAILALGLFALRRT